MIILDYLGEPLTHQKVVPGDTSTAFDSSCYFYKEFTILVDGVDATSTEACVAAGTWIYGGTSNARSVIVSATLDSGAWGNANARVTLRIKSVSKTWASTENVGSGADGTRFTVRADTVAMPVPGVYENKGRPAKAALVSVYAQTALVSLTGAIPDQTALIGQPMAAASSIILSDINEIIAFKCIDYASGSASNIQATFFF